MALDQSALTELLDALRSGGDLDFMREAMQLVLQALIDLEATEKIGAARYERTDNRTTHRNGSRSRLLSTKAGDVELAIPKLRHGSFFPALLEPRRRIDRALWAVIMEAFVHGVSTRKVDDLVAALGIDAGVSKSQVSRICAELDQAVSEFRERRLDHIDFPYVFVDATYVKAHDGAWVVSKAIIVATGVAADGNREVLGLAVGDSEDKAFWTAFLRSLRARGLAGVRLVISDAHEGLRSSIEKVMLGAAWQRCRVHFMRNVLARVPRGSQEMVAAAIRTVFAQPDAAAVADQLDSIAGKLGRQFPAVETMLREAATDVCAFTAFPIAHWKKVWSTNPVRHEALTDRAEMKGLRLRAVAAACRSWRQSDPGGAGKGGSSLDNVGTGRHCQTARAQQARRRGVRVQKPVVEPPQVERRLEPGGCGPVSSACSSPRWRATRGRSWVGRPEATMKNCGVVVARLQGKSWAPIPSTDQQ